MAVLLAALCAAPSAGLRAQLAHLQAQVRATPGASLTPIPNETFGKLHCLVWPVPIDHTHPERGLLLLRAYIGVCDTAAPVVLALDGYGIDYAQRRDYRHELAEILGANLVLVEHRYFGQSRPAVLDYDALTLAQAAADAHAIRRLLDGQFSGSWLSAGISKGGHAALCHRMQYPNDVDATVVYGTAVKRQPMRQAGDLLAPLMATEAGQAVTAIQERLMRDGDILWPIFQEKAQTINFGDLSPRLAWDFMRLEYPFSYWQTAEPDPKLMDHTTWSPVQVVSHLLATVSLRTYTPATRQRWEPAYYMFYHELGYYEYDTTAWQRHLAPGNHGNGRFAPQGLPIRFDGQYLRDLSDFMDNPLAHTVLFVYGENDPWARWSAVERNRYEVPGGNHASRIKDLPSEQRAELLRRLVGFLKR